MSKNVLKYLNIDTTVHRSKLLEGKVEITHPNGKTFLNKNFRMVENLKIWFSFLCVFLLRILYRMFFKDRKSRFFQNLQIDISFIFFPQKINGVAGQTGWKKLKTLFREINKDC